MVSATSCSPALDFGTQLGATLGNLAHVHDQFYSELRQAEAPHMRAASMTRVNQLVKALSDATPAKLSCSVVAELLQVDALRLLNQNHIDAALARLTSAAKLIDALRPEFGIQGSLERYRLVYLTVADAELVWTYNTAVDVQPLANALATLDQDSDLQVALHSERSVLSAEFAEWSGTNVHLI